jgi:type II secretory pathway pseudopilin PulG
MGHKLLVISSCRGRRGQLLLELLVTIGVTALIAGIVAQIIYVSLRSNQSGGESNVAQGLAEETFDAIRNATTENWLNLYNLTHSSGTVVYYPAQSGGKWVNTTGTESVVVNGVAYSRSFYVQHACRDVSTRAITGVTDTQGVATTTCTVSGGSGDTSTEKVIATVSWSTGNPISYVDYVTRWRNQTCVQTSWAGGSTSSAVTCPSTTYGSSTSVTVGATLELTPN